MPMTPKSSSTPYVTAEQFFEFYGWQLAADMLRNTPESPRPSYLALLDQSNPAGAKLYRFLSKGAGEIEAHCLIAGKYNPDDLAALTGMSQVLLQALNSARAMWGIYQRLKPGSARMEDCPGAKESHEMLMELRDGKTIFGFEEVQAAGLPSVNPPAPASLLTPNAVSRAYRLFPNYGPNAWSGQGD